MSRILENAENQITNGFHATKHQAVDVVKKTNQLANIIAHSDGEVVWVQTGMKNNQGSTGNASYNGLYTLYAHGQDGSRRVSAGDTVTQGQQIMNVGSTGNSSGPHLHFEVRNEKDVRINPTPYIDSDLPKSAVKNENSAVKSAEEIAKEVIAGKWGNGDDRKNRLTSSGYNYSEIQAKVNEMLRTPSKATKIVYVVKSGDTLSSIARKYNTTWQKIYEDNKSVIGSNPNLIKAGQKLEI